MRSGWSLRSRCWQWAREVAPGADFVVGGAESLPFARESVDLITAAGSLNYADPELFFGEARRVLRPGGVVVVYDFSTGRSLRESPQLDEWFERFVERYPWPPNEARVINADVLREVATGFMVSSEDFEIGVRMGLDAYVEYMMTETNVAFAIRNGAVRRGRARVVCRNVAADLRRRGARGSVSGLHRVSRKRAMMSLARDHDTD